ncbi:MAG TPA: hypothetical protein VNF47_09320 [Streptosporangiaceae bacterium]|nr:hypothetical protein [Streptosporangiaceae bacterium]
MAGRGRAVAEAGRWQQVSWPVAHAAFAQPADPLLSQPMAPVDHLGTDEHRRGRPRWRSGPVTGEYVLLAGRWHTWARHGRRGRSGASAVLTGVTNAKSESLNRIAKLDARQAASCRRLN